MQPNLRSARVAGSLLLLTGASALSCTRAVPESRATKEPAASSSEVQPPAPAAESIDERFASELKAVFAGYKPWGRVDDEMRWAPWLCRMPEPGRTAMSAATAGGHARKLYSLFAKNRSAYVNIGAASDGGAKEPSSVGQVIVKESYLPEVVQLDASPGNALHGLVIADGGLGEADHFNPYVTENGTTYKASTLAGVYVMLRKDPSTPNTDDGWVYGTLRANGELTSAGRVSSCMGCHTTKPGRLFGPRRE